MESLNPKEAFEKVKEKYLSFILTTTCRNNTQLYNELKEIFLNKEILWRDLLIQSVVKYKTLDANSFNNIGFNEKFKDLVANKLPSPYAHQVIAWNKILKGENCIIATGTASGKTEGFLLPIINHCLIQKSDGIQAIIIYPLKALAKDQGKRIGELLDDVNRIFGSNIKWGILDGDTGKGEPTGYKSEITSKEEMISNPPNILLTNYAMLERILLNPQYVPILKNSKVSFIVLDEIHYYRGAQGIDVSLLMRRLQFHLSLQQDITKIKYVGTSATLGNPNSKEVFDFIFKLFNIKLSKEAIVEPQFSEEFENDILRNPTFQNKINASALENRDIRAYAFFCAPSSLFRCLSCKKINTEFVGICYNCNSKMIFEMLTCRQCGIEYFNFDFSESSQNRSDITFDALQNQIIDYLRRFGGNEEERCGEIVLSKTAFENETRKLKLCTDCTSLHSDLVQQCLKCGGSKFLEVYAVENPEKPIILNQQSNNSYCPSCKFEGSNPKPIQSISKISDENCSHIVFDEFFMSLPPERQKLLVFTDSVQRASKFAREIEETHMKNIARAELHKRILKITEPVYLPNVIFDTISNIKRKTTVDNVFEQNLKKELYEELFGSGKKVASLVNRGLFKLQVFNLQQFGEADSEKIIKAFEVFKRHTQVLSYYEIINSLDFSLHKFYDNDQLIEKLHRAIYNLKRKRLVNRDFAEARRILNLLNEKGFLNEKEEKYFFKEESIEVCKGNFAGIDKNYYDSWIDISNIPIIKTKIDVSNINTEERSKTETDFKQNKKTVNFLVATPTLELGIDIGDLDAIGLLYSPPSPAQYVQRGGRSGRGGKSNITFTYLSRKTLDTIYFNKPQDLVSGKINPPSFTIDLEPPIKKALFSLFFYFTLYHTNFRKENEGLAFDKINTWENYFDKIKVYWISYETNFSKFLRRYLEMSNIKIDTNNLIEEWIKKLEDFIELQKSLKNQFKQNIDIYKYFQEAGLLPDYAFGMGGPIVLVTGMDPIQGFRLEQVAPPSTIDYNKGRYISYKIDMYPATRVNIIAETFWYCPVCQDVISINGTSDSCQLCNSIFSKENKKIIEPKVIRAKRSTFSLNQRFVNWKYNIIDPPKKILFKNEFVSNPFVCEIGTFFESVREDDKNNNYFICEKENCGEVYLKENSRSSDNTHVHTRAELKLGSKFKTRAVIFDLTTFAGHDFRTLLNTLISATTFEAGCEDGEIAGFVLNKTSKIILFDDVDGGVGFVDILSNKYEHVLKIAKELCEQTCCKNGCPKCISSYWRQRDLDYLQKKDIIPLLNQLLGEK